MKNRIFSVILGGLLFFLLGFTFEHFSNDTTPDSESFEHFELEALTDSLKASGRPYLPFLNRSTLRCGIYRLEAGAEDGQAPHKMDEVYYVLKGKAQFRVENEEAHIKTGDVFFVAANATHQFFKIEEDLELLVFFSTKTPD